MAYDTEYQEIKLSKPQFQLVSSKAAFPAFVGGFGSGKTEALINRMLFKKSQYPDLNVAYYLPTFDLIGMIAFPRFEEKLEEMCYGSNSMRYKSVKAPRPHIDIFDGDDEAGSIIFRSMDNPSRIVGYEVADSCVDELDILKTEDAKTSWQKIIARNRQKKSDGKRNTVAVGCTPEGFRFVYDNWKKNPRPGYQLIQASTYSNQKNLPREYIPDLLEAYPSNLIQAYIDGDFVNLTSGTVYFQFDRKLNAAPLGEGIVGDEDLYIGMDFNVTNMAAVVFVKRKGLPIAVAELTGIYDTPAMISALNMRFPNNRKMIFPDASGDSRKSNNASTSDIQLLKEAKFFVFAKDANPFVKDRVLSMNAMFCNGTNERRFLVNINNCPILTDALEKQAYDKNGEPDKTSGLDHILDACGYYIYYEFPIRSQQLRRVQMAGV